MYYFAGYHKNNKSSGFRFVIPIFRREDEFYYCRNDFEKGIILSFVKIEIGAEDVEYVENEFDEFSEGSEVVFAFVLHHLCYCGDKVYIFQKLRKLIDKKQLSNLEKYDIYFFLTETESAKREVLEYVTKIEYVVSPDNFLYPEVEELSRDQFIEKVNKVAEMLTHRDYLYNYWELFNGKDDEWISFLKYRVRKSSIAGSFEIIINQIESEYSKDVVVHCFIQSGLSDQSICNTDSFKLRQLFDFAILEKYSSKHAYRQLFDKMTKKYPGTNLSIAEKRKQLDETLFSN